jgi:CcmD family protein
MASNDKFIIAAYSVAWAVIVGYVWRLAALKRRAVADQARVTHARDAGVSS